MGEIIGALIAFGLFGLAFILTVLIDAKNKKKHQIKIQKLAEIKQQEEIIRRNEAISALIRQGNHH